MKTVSAILWIIILIWLVIFYLNIYFINSTNIKKEINIQNLSQAYFAWGCFWCIEWIFEAQNWVYSAEVWYLWWEEKTANYDNVSSWNTKHREWVKILYDADLINYKKLSELFWTQIDPTDEGGQFSDRGFHYTTALYFSNKSEKDILEKSKENLELSWKFDKKIATKILPFTTFFKAEEYHQDYYKKSSLKYNLYKKLSGRKDFIKNNWADRIVELEKKEEPKWYKNYSPEKIVNASEENIILFFHADWCSTCVAFEKKVLSEKIPDNILILKVNYDKELELRKKYNIITQTSFVLIDNKWNLIKRWIWWRWIDNIIKKIEEVKSIWEISKTYSKKDLKKRLTPLQYKVTQEGWTEPAFNNKYWDNHQEGIYVDIVDRTALFSSTDKYDSWTGWPAFTKPIDENFLQEKDDYKLIIKRTEIKSDSSHLGHVFEDGPSDKWWLRYCINSAALDFIPKEKLKGTQYEKYLSLFEKK